MSHDSIQDFYNSLSPEQLEGAFKSALLTLDKIIIAKSRSNHA